MNLDKQQRVLNWIFSENFQIRHQAIVRDKVPNSGQWFLQHHLYQNWLNDKCASILCCQGIRKLCFSIFNNWFSGCWQNIFDVSFFICIIDGSSLAIDDILSRSNASVTYIYFDYKDAVSQNVNYVIWSPLLYSSSTAYQQAESIYNEAHKAGKGPDPSAFMALLRQAVIP